MILYIAWNKKRDGESVVSSVGDAIKNFPCTSGNASGTALTASRYNNAKVGSGAGDHGPSSKEYPGRGFMDYTQPFSTTGGKGRFVGCDKWGYLPPLELPDTPPEPLEPQPEWYEYNRLQMLVLDLQNRLNKHIDRSKRVDRL